MYVEEPSPSAEISTITKTIFSIIAAESRNHAKFLELVAEQNNLFEETDCSQTVGIPWAAVQKLREELSSGRVIGLKEFIERQMWLEKAVGEETYHKIVLPLIREGIKAGCITREYANILETLFSKMILDEEYHEEMLKILAELSG
ncbi:MAG: hypothetical protein N3E36_06805 [Sulfolobales archaeon]|nr:hypothetical protein [Sulfolobales archaeon]